MKKQNKSFLQNTNSIIVGIVILVSFLFSAPIVQATSKTPVASGNWNSASTWSPSGVPAAGDDVTINGGFTVTVNVNTAVLNSLTISSGSSLTIGAYTISVSGSTIINGTLNITSLTGTKTFTGSVTINNGGSIAESASAALSFGSDVTINNGGTLTENGSAVVGIGGSFLNNGTYTASTGIHTFSGTSKTISGSTTTSIPSITITGTMTNNGALAVSVALSGTGTLTNSGTLSVGGSCSITTFVNSGTTSISGSGTISTALAKFTNTGTLNLNGSGSITGITNSTGGIVNLTSSGTISSFNNSSSTSTFNISALTVPSITSLTIGTTGNTVNYCGAGSQTLKDAAYSNLTTSGSGIKTWTEGASRIMTGNLIIGDGTTLSVAGANILTVSGTTTIGNGTSGTLNITNASGTKTFTGTVTINNGGSLVESVAALLTFGSDVTINNGTLTENGSAVVSIAGNLTNNGSYTASTGIHTFSGTNKTINGSSVTSIPSVAMTGTITNTGTLTIGTALTGAGAISNSGTLNIGATCSVTTLSNSGTTNVSGSGTISTALANYTNTGILNLNGSGAITGITNSTGGVVNLYSSNTITTFNNSSLSSILNIFATSVPTISTLTVSASGNTVNYCGTGSQTIKDVAYSNLIISGSGTKTWTEGAIRTLAGNLTIGNGTTLSIAGAYAFTVGGTTVIGGGTSGTISITNATGTKTFSGSLTINNGGLLTESVAAALLFGSDVTINNGGTLNENGNAVVGFAGSLLNNGTYNASTGIHTFSGTLKTISGSTTTSIPNIAVSGTISNNGTLTVNTAITGAGTLSNAATGTLNFAGASIAGTLDASIAGNTVNYTGAGQTVYTTTYSNLILSNTGAKIITSLTTINGNLLVSGSATTSATTALTINGDFILASGTIFTAGSFTHNVRGNWINNGGTFNSTGSIINFNGSVAQTIGGSVPTTFATLKINNSNGVTLTAASTITNLTIGDVTSGSTFSDGGYQITATGTLNLTSGTFKLGGTSATTWPAFATKNISAGSTVEYASCAAQTVSNIPSYQNLTLSGSSVKTPAGALTIAGNFTINSGSFSAGSFSHSIGGNFINNGTFNCMSSTVNFNGTLTQTILTNSSPFYNITLNNISGANAFTVSDAMSITHSCTFSYGIVYFAGGSLTFTDGASCNGGSKTSFVSGPVKKTGTSAFTFPVGDAADQIVWAPVGIDSHSASDIIASYSFVTSTNNWDPQYICNTAQLDHTSGVEHWDLTSSNSVYPAVTLHWKYASTLNGIMSPADIVVAHWTGTCWESMNTSKNTFGAVGDTGFIKSSDIFTSFGSITLGTKKNSNPLPIQLLNFDANCGNNGVDLTWTTATELNNDYFTIERSSDATNWQTVTTVKGAGNSNMILNYSISDENSIQGISYYRLKQTDFDGKSETFSPVSVSCNSGANSTSVSYYPNPFLMELTMEVKNTTSENGLITVYDLSGKKVFTKTISKEDLDNQTSTLDLKDLTKGIYTIEFRSSTYSSTKKIVKD